MLVPMPVVTNRLMAVLKDMSGSILTPKRDGQLSFRSKAVSPVHHVLWAASSNGMAPEAEERYRD